MTLEQRVELLNQQFINSLLSLDQEEEETKRNHKLRSCQFTTRRRKKGETQNIHKSHRCRELPQLGKEEETYKDIICC